ncbi:MAG: AAA family ATPase [Candidatus Omnitrophica bacterium]|nr:AAA family ATPase [Candidatus Omnitrophota bacterium]
MQKELQYNQTILRRFAVLDRKNRLGHAYLFAGPPGIGKTETALAIAKLVNCEARREEMFCDACPSCIQVNTGNHPDVFVVSHEGGEPISIEEIRELLSCNKLRSFMGGKKVLILKNIESLTLDGANAFLKTLEEPTAETLILLTTSTLETVLSTIQSRCHVIHFPFFSDHDLAERLNNGHGLDTHHSRVYTYFAQGSLTRARQLKEGRFVDRKNEIIDEFILNRPSDARIKGLLKDEEETKRLFNILLSWVRDAMLAKANVQDGRLVHQDRLDDLSGFVKKYTFEELKNLNGSVVKMGRLVADKLNIKLPLLIIGEQLWRK